MFDEALEWQEPEDDGDARLDFLRESGFTRDDILNRRYMDPDAWDELP